jgi:hypothetical protein
MTQNPSPKNSDNMSKLQIFIGVFAAILIAAFITWADNPFLYFNLKPSSSQVEQKQ